MKKTKILIVFLGIILLSNFVCFNAFSANTDDSSGTLIDGLDKAAKKGGLVKAGEETPTIQAVIGKYIKAGLSLVGLVFMIIIIYAGLSWLTSGGDSEYIKKARSWMIHGAIGFAVTMMAYLATHFAIEQIAGTLK